MKTRSTELLNIETPIVCGGMIRVGTADLAAAASNVGALGVMTALTQPTAEGLEAEIARCAAMAEKPPGVNLTVGVVASQINYDDYVDVIIKSGVKWVPAKCYMHRNPDILVRIRVLKQQSTCSALCLAIKEPRKCNLCPSFSAC